MTVYEMIDAVFDFNPYIEDLQEFGDFISSEFEKLSDEDKDEFIDSMAGETLYMMGYRDKN